MNYFRLILAILMLPLTLVVVLYLAARSSSVSFQRPCAIALLLIFFWLPACTITPKTVRATAPSFSQGVRNSSIVSFDKSGAIIDAHGRDRYNALIETYGQGFAPALKPDEGLTPLADATYHIDSEHLSKALQMNLWRRSGQPPIKKGLLDRAMDVLK